MLLKTLRIIRMTYKIAPLHVIALVIIAVFAIGMYKKKTNRNTTVKSINDQQHVHVFFPILPSSFSFSNKILIPFTSMNIHF
jgi:amino acid permease